MMSAPIRILIVAALCIAGLIGLVVRETMARDAGREVLLPMEAVDPRALLQGHYVIVDIRDRLEADEQCPPSTISGEGWIALAPGDPAYRVVGAARIPEEAATGAPGEVLVRGDFYCQAPMPEQVDVPAQPGWVTIGINTDRFYVDQSGAQRIERVLRDQTLDTPGRVYAIVSIGEDGRARLKGLQVDGERLELSWS